MLSARHYLLLIAPLLFNELAAEKSKISYPGATENIHMEIEAASTGHMAVLTQSHGSSVTPLMNVAVDHSAEPSVTPQPSMARSRAIMRTAKYSKQQASSIDVLAPEDNGRETVADKAVPKEGFRDKRLHSWSRPIVLGLILGFVLVGPDHLGSLMAFSSVTTTLDSFKVGFSWGLSHSVGMILICPIFYLIKEVAAEHNIPMNSCEYYGDYFIGVSMILLAVYFKMYESRYLGKQAEPSYCVKDDGRFCEAYAEAARQKCQKQQARQKASEEIIGDTQEDAPAFHLCCPNLATIGELQRTVLGTLRDVQGVVFLGHMSMTTSPSKLISFAAVLVLSSAFVSGSIAFGWGLVGKALFSPRTLYRASCFATLALGISWIVANTAGALDSIEDFAEQALNRRIMQGPLTPTA